MEKALNSPDNYIQTLISLKQKINLARYKSLVAVNQEMILVYLEIGKTISEQVKQGWGSAVIERLATDLQTEYNGVSGFSARIATTCGENSLGAYFINI